MKIGGLQPVTLLDYPQKVAAIIFTVGCNMRCPFCYNPSLVLSNLEKDNKSFKEMEVLSFLKKRKKYLDGIVITGGEPTLQTDLPKFCQKLKKLGYSIKLDTNGMLPDVLENLIGDKLVDYIAMDIKGPLESYSKSSGMDTDVKNIQKSVKMIIKGSLPHEFRTTLVRGLHSKKDIVSMARIVLGADKYFLQNFKDHKKLVGEGFRGRSFTNKLMKEFREIADKYVKECEIR